MSDDIRAAFQTARNTITDIVENGAIRQSPEEKADLMAFLLGLGQPKGLPPNPQIEAELQLIRDALK